MTDLGTAHLTPGPHTVREGVVSVILVNFHGADDTIVCLKAFDDVDWPADKLELIVVDNDSGDGQAERIAQACPTARVIESGGNLGFAGGCNLGVDHAEGQYVAFLNNDARPGRRWIAAAVETMESDPTIRAVASKVLDWDGKLVDYVDGSLAWFGMGYKREAERPDDGSYEVGRDVLFGTGAAFFIVAEDYREVGGFDERFFLYCEETDLCWRLKRAEWEVVHLPQMTICHFEDDRRGSAALEAQAAYARMQFARKHFPDAAADYRWAMALRYGLRVGLYSLRGRRQSPQRASASAALSTVLHGDAPFGS